MGNDYGDLRGLVDQVTAAAIGCALRDYGWQMLPDGSKVFNASNEDAPEIADGPGHGYPDTTITKRSSYYDMPGERTTLGALYQLWEGNIEGVFRPFFDIPDPAGFQGLADDVRGALEQLSAKGNTGDGSKGGGDAAHVDYAGNTTLGLANQVAQTLNTWQGAAATSFATYLNLFTVVVANQATAGEVLRMCLLMEMEEWKRLRADVVSMASNAASAFANPYSGDISTVLSVAGTINTVLGWFPAFKPVSEAADKGLTILGLVNDTIGGGEPPANPLSGSDAEEILSHLQTAAKDAKKTSHTVESDIQKTLQNLKSVIGQAPPARTNGTADEDSFRLARPEGTYDATGATGADNFFYPGVVINYANVKTAAHQLEDELAPEMLTASRDLERSNDAGPWLRDDSLGLGMFGCYDDFWAALDAIQTEVDETAHEIEWAGGMLRVIVKDYRSTDGDVGTDFDHVRHKIHDYDHPAPPLPAPGPGHRPVPEF